METLLPRAVEFALAHPHALPVASFAALSGLLWIASRLLARRAPVTLNERAAAEATAAREEARR